MNNNQNLSDGFLVDQYKSGVITVLPILVKRWHKKFCEKAYWVTKDKDLAKDIAQDCWVTIIAKIDSLESSNSFKSWAFRIVYTKAIDSLKLKNKSNKDLKTITREEYAEEYTEDNKSNIKKVLLKAIQDLPKEKQDVIMLFYVEEYSLKEISAFLKIPIGTVKSRLFQAREKLKSIVKNRNYEK